MYDIICWKGDERKVIDEASDHESAVALVAAYTKSNTNEYWICYRLQSMPLNTGWTGRKGHTHTRYYSVLSSAVNRISRGAE